LIRKEPTTVEIHSLHSEDQTVISIPELTDGIKMDTVNSPCLFISSGEKHVFQFTKLEGKIVHKIAIHTTSN
jgi:hypothetical protein